MIEINEVEFEYPGSDFRLSVDEVRIRRGEKVAVVGPSGSGKTTLLNLVCGISVPRSGAVSVLEQNVSSMSDAERRRFRVKNIGSIFQQFELVDYLNVNDNILLPFFVNSTLNLDRGVRQLAEQLAERVGIADKLKRRVTRLSQGEQQRVAICRALLTKPDLILADEPTGNLDPANKQRIIELLFQQCQENDLTLVTVTHDAGILDGFDRTIDFEQFRSVTGVDA